MYTCDFTGLDLLKSKARKISDPYAWKQKPVLQNWSRTWADSLNNYFVDSSKEITTKSFDFFLKQGGKTNKTTITKKPQQQR